MVASTICRTTLNYAARGGLGSGTTAVEVEVHDGRATDLPGWRECGFELVDNTSVVADWTDDDEIAGVHYAEIEALTRSLTGCAHALVSDHVKRRAAAPARREQAPVTLVHSDFAPGYEDVIRNAYRDVHGRGAATLARSGLTSADIESAERIVMMQFWRNLGSPDIDLPVAWCDARTVTPEEGRPFPYTGYVAGGRTFDALAIAAPGEPCPHQWYSFPGLTADEVVAFRTYDTELVDRGETYFTPHSAFHPDRGAGGAPRFSIELRVLCLFE